MLHKKKVSLLRKGIAAFLLLLMLGSGFAFAAEADNTQSEGELQTENTEQPLTPEEETDNQAQANQNVETGDVEMDSSTDEEKVVEELQDSGGVILFGQGDPVSSSASSEPAKTVTLSWGKNVDYEKTAIHSFKVNCNGTELPAYCVEPTQTHLPKGSHTATAYNSPLITKALYYSYGYPGYSERTAAYLAGVSMKNVYKSDKGRFALCHMVLSYIYDGKSSKSDAFVGVCSATKTLVKNLTAAMESWPDPPGESTISLSSGTVDASWDWEKKCQITPEIKVSGTEGNTISVNVPEGATLIKGQQEATSGYMTVSSGESFSFSAPAGVTGKYNSPAMEASIRPFQPYLIYSKKKQDLVFGVSSATTISFSINWANFGDVELVKTSSDPSVTEGNTYYSLKGAEYGLYRKETDDKFGNLITDQEGKASMKNVPYGEYYLKELEPSQGYAIDVSAHDITVSSPSQSESVLEKPVIPDITTSAYIAETGQSSATEGGTVNISDTVKYSGVEPGLTYTIEGRLMNKATGEEVPGTTSQVEFTPEKSSGSLKMDYSLDSSGLGGNTVVAFEKLYQGGNLIASHEDINNKAQSVNFVKPRDRTPDMGDDSRPWMIAFALALSLLVGIRLKPLKN